MHHPLRTLMYESFFEPILRLFSAFVRSCDWENNPAIAPTTLPSPRLPRP